MKRLSFLFVFVLFVINILMTACTLTKTDNNAKVQKTSESIETQRLDKEKMLGSDIDSVMKELENNGTDYSVFVYIPEIDISYTFNDKRMGSASMIKVFIMEMVYNEIKQGNISEDFTLPIERDTRVGGAGSLQGYAVGTKIKVSTLLKKMIVESDNTATNMFIKYLGMEKINEYMKASGYNNSLLRRRMMDYKALQAGRDNQTSVNDLGLFFKRIYSGKAVSRGFDRKMVEILKQQEDNNKIPFYLPKGVEVAHKTGEINAVMNDGGIVFEKHPYILCILSDKAPGYNLAIKQVAKLAEHINKVVQNDKYYTQLDNAKKDNNQQDNVKPSVAIIEPNIIDKPVPMTDYKRKLMNEYSLKHFGKEMTTIEPQVVVVHWTAENTMDSAFNWFYHEEYKNAPGTLNVGSQFIVDRDGKIYRIMPETALARHSIGYNWCAIGIENVGGANHVENLTPEQIESNIKLISYLKLKYPTIKYVWGHYQQDKAKKSGLYKELVAGYYSEKVDPGPKFMRNLRQALSSKDIIFFEE